MATSRSACSQQVCAVRILRKPWADDVQRTLRGAGKNQGLGETGTRCFEGGPGVDCRLKEANRVPRVAPLRGDTPVVIQRVGILGLYLQSVAELDTGFVQIPLLEVLLAALQVAHVARACPTTAAQHYRQQRCQEADLQLDRASGCH